MRTLREFKERFASRSVQTEGTNLGIERSAAAAFVRICNSRFAPCAKRPALFDLIAQHVRRQSLGSFDDEVRIRACYVKDDIDTIGQRTAKLCSIPFDCGVGAPARNITVPQVPAGQGLLAAMSWNRAGNV